MATCPYCGSDVSFSAKFCTNCGARLAEVPVEQTEPAAYQPVSLNEESTSWPQQEPAPEQEPEPQPDPYAVQQPYYTPQPVTPVATGSLLAWSIITILLCTIPGLVALAKTLGINKATTVEEQMKKISSARTWCMIGTVMGILFGIVSFFGRMI